VEPLREAECVEQGRRVRAAVLCPGHKRRSSKDVAAAAWSGAIGKRRHWARPDNGFVTFGIYGVGEETFGGCITRKEMLPMSDHEEFRRQLAARWRQVARELLDHVANANSREQKRQLAQRALAMVQNAEALLPFAGESECVAADPSLKMAAASAMRGDRSSLPITGASNARPAPAKRPEQGVEPLPSTSGANASQLASGHHVRRGRAQRLGC
jgi:hypothetical protein